MKSDVGYGIMTIQPYQPINTICMGRSPFERPFFFLYSCLFSNLHTSLPFDNFTMSVLQALNVAPSHTPATFLSYYTSHPAKPVIWQSLNSWSGNVLFNSFNTSYKNFKGEFFKVFIQFKDMKFFFYKVGRSRFPMFWTRNPSKFREWTQSTPCAEKREIYSLFNKLPRKHPTRKLLTVYKSFHH